jgi:hypothetical protein
MKILKSITKILSIIIGISILLLVFRAYFIRTLNTYTGQTYDGLGRVLTEPPVWAKIFITSENSWAGLGWHLLDFFWVF